MKILIIEDDQKISDYISKGFNEQGESADTIDNGRDGLTMALDGLYDLLIVDVMLPGCDGLTIIDQLRSRGCLTPIIILSAKRSVEDRVRGLEIGSDDYLTKPFSFTELQARAQALMRRSSVQVDPFMDYVMRFHDLSLDPLRKVAFKGEKKISLQPREFQLLEYLMRNPERVLSKTMILEYVWEYNFDPQTNVVDVLVCRLRSKIDRGFSLKLLHTLRGVGYVLKVDE